MATVGFRGRNIRYGRSLRRRHDSEDEIVQIDWTKGARSNLNEILWNVVCGEHVSTGKKLSYLNMFTKLCSKEESICKDSDFTFEEIFCSLRVALFHDKVEVRAAGFRAIRYLLKDVESVKALCRINLPLLIVKSLDIALENKIERLQSLRLIRQLLAACPECFPKSITRCLVSMARDGIQEKDVLVRSCWAILAELTLLNPKLSAECGGISAIVESIAQGNQSHYITEALLSCLLYLLNYPLLRPLLREDFDLQHFVATYTDCYVPTVISAQRSNDPSLETLEQRETKFLAAKNAITSMMRSWPGLVYMCKKQYPGYGGPPNGLQALIETLHMPYADVRKHLMELFFELLNFPVPTYTEDFHEALMSCHPSAMQDSWQLYDGFVSAEGKSLLPHVAKSRQNLMDNYLAILLYSFISHGLLEALVVVITKPKNVCNSVRATILLGEVLHLSSQLLPSEIGQMCHSLPDLVNAATSSDLPHQRDVACAAISCLNKMHSFKKQPTMPCSLFLEQVIQFCTPSGSVSKPFSEVFAKSKLIKSVKREQDESVTSSFVKDFLVSVSEDVSSWDWDLLTNILTWPSDGLKRFEDIQHRTIIRRLITFFKPSSKQYSQLDSNEERARTITLVGCHLIDFLLEAEETKAHEFLDDLLADITTCLTQITEENAPQSAIFSPTKLLSTPSHNYFLLIGRMSGSNKGKKLLEKSGIYQLFLGLVTKHEVYAKLILSSLDYTKEGNFSRPLFAKALTSSSDSARLYATNYLRVLLRAGLSDFRKWALELLLLQLSDKSPAVTITAIDILDEACDCQPNLDALITMRPSVLHIGDSGVLLFVRFVSTASGFKYMTDTNQLADQLNKWDSFFNLKYVKIVENLLNETLTYHKRSEDGTYGRRTDRRLPYKTAYIPSHLYGQLAKHEEGIAVLASSLAFRELIEKIRHPSYGSDSEVTGLKGALWAVGHTGSTKLGFSYIRDQRIIDQIISLASESPVFSLRGTSFYVLGLLSSTDEGANYLRDRGWESIRHVRGEKWPLSRDATHEEAEYFDTMRNKEYSWSVSSTGTRLTEVYDILSGKKKISAASTHSFGLEENDTNEKSENDELTYGSLPELDEQQSDDKALHVKTLSRVSSLSPQHRPSFGNRPRSASDIQTSASQKLVASRPDNELYSGLWMSKKDITEQNQVSSAQGTSQAEGENVGEVKKATIKEIPRVVLPQKTPSSAARYSNTLPPNMRYNGRSDSDFSRKSRSGSQGESGTSSFISSTMTMKNSLPKLSPIASVMSFNSSLGYASSGPHNVYNTIPRLAQSMRSPDNFKALISMEPTPTNTDAMGYATLRAIQRKRVRSLAFYHQSVSTGNGSDESSDEDSPLLATNEVKFSASLNLSGLRHRTRLVSQSSEETGGVFEAEPGFVGLCLPSDLSFIFSFDNAKQSSNLDDDKSDDDEIKFEKSFKTHLDKISNDSLAVNNGLELHNEHSCLSCNVIFPKKVITDSSKEVHGGQPSKVHSVSSDDKSAHLSVRKPIELDVPSSSFTSNSSAEQGQSRSPDPLSSQILIRREVLRFVTNLSGSVAARAAEQGLLNLKQRYPSAFQDVCLYSEVSLQMATYNFRLQARRFIQELFMDLSFDQLKFCGEEIVRKKVFQKRGSDEAVLSENQ